MRRSNTPQNPRGLPRVRVSYRGSSYQNPSGVRTSIRDRKILAALAHQYGLVIVEDGAYDELGFVDTLPSIKQYDRDGHVVYMGTFSKTLGPGLRVGWAVGNDRVLTAMERLKKDLGHPMAEALVGRYLRCYDAHVRSLQQSYRIRRDAVVETLQKSVLPEGIPPYLKADIFYGFSCQKAGQANRLRMRGASGV